MSALIDSFVKRISDASKVLPIVEEAIYCENLFVYGEILDIPKVIELKTSNPTVFETLNCLAYKNYKDVPKELLTNEIIKRKMKRLTLFSLCANSHAVSYDDIRAALDEQSDEEVEMIVIGCINEEFLDAKLDQKSRTLDITLCRVLRDVPRSKQLAKEFIDILTTWEIRCSTARKLLLERVSEVSVALLKENLENDVDMK